MDSWSPGTTDCEYSIMASNGSGGLASWTIAYQLPLRTQLEASAEESGFVEVPSDSRSYPWIGFMWDGTPIEIPAEIRGVWHLKRCSHYAEVFQAEPWRVRTHSEVR